MEEPNGNGRTLLAWKWISGLELTIITMFLGFYVTHGFDEVHYHDLDSILANRTPWTHDKGRIEEQIRRNEDDIRELKSRFEAREKVKP